MSSHNIPPYGSFVALGGDKQILYTILMLEKKRFCIKFVIGHAKFRVVRKKCGKRTRKIFVFEKKGQLTHHKYRNLTNVWRWKKSQQKSTSKITHRFLIFSLTRKKKLHGAASIPFTNTDNITCSAGTVVRRHWACSNGPSSAYGQASQQC